MRRTSATLVALCACLLAAAALAAQAPASQAPAKEVTLAATYKAGDVTRYKTRISFTAATAEGVLTSTNQATVKEIRKTGDIVVNTVIQDAHVSVGGNEQDVQDLPTIGQVRSKQGKLVEFTLGESMVMPFTPEVGRAIYQLSEVLFPEKAVAPGGTWQTELANPMVKGKKILVKDTFIGMDKVDTLDCWKIKQTGEADTEDPNARLKVEATFWLDPANGRIVKLEGTAKDVPTQLGPATLVTTQTLVKQ